MELFDINGCLTNEGIQMIIKEELNPMESLEASEHLSFCDTCLLRYTTAICSIPEDELLIPQGNICKKTILAIKQRMIAVFYHRYVTVAIASSFGILITFSGVFDSFSKENVIPISNHEKYVLSQEKQQEFQEKTSEVLNNILNLTFLKGE